MRRFVCAALLATALALPLAQARGPKLLVVIVVDQMRADYVTRFQKDWTGGLKRIVTGGAVFENAAYPYLTTVTCAGHASISTATFPHTHGIVHNQWWDRASGKVVTCTGDPRSKGIGYGVNFQGGDSAWRLQRPTFTDVMREQRGSHVVTLALKDRAAVILAGHGGDAITWFSEPIGGWVTSMAFAKEPLPAVNAFTAANPIAADSGKTWSRVLQPSKYGYPDDQPGEAPIEGWTRTFPHVLKTVAGAAADATYVTQWERSPFADAYVGRFAAALVDAFGIGRHDTTDVLGLSFSTPDMIGHAYGPRSEEIQDAYAQLDATLGTLFAHLDRTVGAGQWTVALSADHGVTPIPEQLAAEGQDAGRLTGPMITAMVQNKLQGALGEGPFVAAAGTNDIYLAAGVYDTLKAQPKLLDSLIQGLRTLPGVARVFRGEELRDPASAKDSLQRAAALSYFEGRSGDLVLALKPGYVLIATGTSHGSATPDDQRVPLIFYGAGVKPGRYKDAATPADLSPTLAAIAGVTMTNIEGRVQSAVVDRQAAVQ